MRVTAPVFIAIFVSILIGFIALIVFMAKRLNGRISNKIFSPIFWFLVGGILFGIVALFQPVTPKLFPIGFVVLLASVLGYTAWSHVVPRAEEEVEI